MNSRFPVWFLSVALGLTATVCTWLGWSAVASLQFHELSQRRTVRFEQLRGVILHLDEVLTMSARMAAATGEPRWEQRYRQFEPQLDAAIKEAIRLDPDPRIARAARQTDMANLKLVEMEYRSFDLVRAGHAAAARALLISPAYEEQKQIYADGMGRLLAVLTDRLARADRLDQLRAHLSLAAALAALVLTAGVWLLAMSRLRHWNSTLTAAVVQRTAALQASETKYRRLFETSRDAIMTLYPPDWKFMSANAATVELFGAKDEKEFTSLGPWEVSPERQPDGELSFVKAQRMIATAMEHGSHFFEWTHRKIGGACFSATVLLTRVEWEGHIKLQATVRDITEQKRAEAAIQRLAQAVEQAAESIVITDLAGTILYINPAFERVSGYTQAEALGQNPRLLKSGKQDAEFYRAMWATLTRGEVWRGHFSNKRKDGTLFDEEAVISPVRDGQGTVVNYVAVKRDVTYERQMEQQFHQAQKMEVIGQLAGGVAHDFNNILTAINGFADLTLARLVPGEPPFRYVEEIHKGADRAAALTRQLLAFSRKQLMQPRLIDLNDVLANVEKMLRRLIGDDVELRIQPAAHLGAVRADAGQIEQVLMNLAVNARDAMPRGGTLLLQTANVTLDADYSSRHPEVVPGEYVMLALTDNGDGMTDEIKAHVFEPFFTTKPQGKGTGLGLATCFGIVKQHDGHIVVHSQADHGTTVKVYLPHQPTAAKTSPPAVGNSDMPRGTETLLLVEDEPAVREIAALVLSEQGYTVLGATDGCAALEVARQRNGHGIHLLVTDVVMPRMGGKELADRLTGDHPDLKVLFASGYTADALGEHGMLEEGLAFLPKPYTAAALACKVREVLDRPDRSQNSETGIRIISHPASHGPHGGCCEGHLTTR